MPGQTIYEKEHIEKPVLYDQRGKPLTYERRRVGFKPPQRKKEETDGTRPVETTG